jgi:3-methylcrotonyl-CoA carboxylase alpha subunit
MFHKILIANRGEIACRVAATARRLGIRTVAVYSDADGQARHVRACDEAVHIGASAPRDSYLRWERILEAAKATGAQAVHPGYGFLSENEDFAQACADAGLVFIGPPPSAIRDMGSKAAAKALMEKAGVPLVPGYHGQDNDPALLQREADRIGYPVLIKASAGGGGKGMRRVERAEDFAAALASCQREAKASFGDDHVLVERYVTRPRHVEIQVFCDAHGGAVHLFERDCSVQRRHQKVLEEAPAPGMTPERRAAMGAAAVAAAQAVGYVGAGTVEFIVEQRSDDDWRFYFMEMNTRLQVEHPVTEAVTGLDLVEWQLRVAAGHPLPRRQDELAIHGHAIEARICAENPESNFLPATGVLQVARWPAHVAFARNASGQAQDLPSAVRLDRGFDEGDAIAPWYDSMIAKLIVWGEGRAQALARLDAALRDTHLVGLHTNVAFLRRVVGSRSFAQADLDTALIERERDALFGVPGLPLPLAVAGALSHRLAQEAEAAASAGPDPWGRTDGWRMNGPSRRFLEFEHGGTVHAVVLARTHEGLPVMTLAGERAALGLRALGNSRHEVALAGHRHTLTVHAAGPRVVVFGEAGSAALMQIDPLARAAEGADTGGLNAPMPGKVLAVHVAPGQAVRRGQALAVMEAMKMEHTISAPRDGVVAEVLHAAGDQVLEGVALLRLQTAASPAG